MGDEYEVRTTRIYRVVCRADWPASARGCSVTGPRASSPDEADELALAAGWEKRDWRWACPAHCESSEYFE